MATAQPESVAMISRVAVGNAQRGCLLLLVAVMSTVAGCKRTAPTGEVSGKVTVAGVPVQFGNIAFIGTAGRVSSGIIERGAYRASQVPTGPVKVTVQAVRLGTPVGHPTLGPMPDSKSAGPFVTVPDRYAMPQTCGLQFEVTPGEQTKDFDLDAK